MNWSGKGAAVTNGNFDYQIISSQFTVLNKYVKVVAVFEYSRINKLEFRA